MKNAYEVRGDVTAIIINSPKYGRLEALISTTKLERVQAFPNSWVIGKKRKNGQLYVHGKLTRKESIQLHRWIINAPDGMLVDHLNNEGLNNTDKNLRLVTNAENKQNLIGAQRNSKTGVRGVSWSVSNEKWVARATVRGKTTHGGYFANINDAERAVKEMRSRLMPFSKEAS